MSLMIANAHITGIDWRHGVGQTSKPKMRSISASFAAALQCNLGMY